MLKATLSAAALAAVLATPAFAQTAPPATPASPTAPKAPETKAPETTGATTQATSGEQFAARAAVGDWRASKLSGVNIYGPDQKSIGKVDDVVVDGSGDAKLVVIAVGGVLGIGAKNVAVPFDNVKWSMEPMKAVPGPAPAGPTGSAPSAPLAPSNTSAAPAATTTAANTAPAVYDYPDHGMISMTADQLKAAPEFHYASEKQK